MDNKNLIVVATINEAKKIANYFNVTTNNPINILDNNNDLLITGVGTSNTLIALAEYINKYSIPKQIINIGICGSYDKNLDICEVVHINEEIYADNVVEDNVNSKFWNSKFKMSDKPEVLKSILPDWSLNINLNKVKGITSNTISGNIKTINFRRQHFLAQVESMEGAAIIHLSNQFNISSIQIRAVSNYVEVRDKLKWQIPEAIQSLSNYFINTIIPILN